MIDEKLWQQCKVCCEGGDYNEFDLPKLLGIVDGNKVILVCGNDLKMEHDMDFVEGGNDLEDHWIGRRFGDKVVLIDYAICSKERPYICYHECCERRYMESGDNYETAHNKANKEERALRVRDSEMLDGPTRRPVMSQDDREAVKAEVATGIKMKRNEGKINVR
jgi:hypothetical protein